MPSQSRSRDRYPGGHERYRERDREREKERERRREREREREYIRGRYEEADEGGGGAASSPNNANARGGRYNFPGEPGRDSYDYNTDDGYEEERRREREQRRERRRQRDEEKAYNEAAGERRRERSKAKESPVTSPIKKRDRERDRDGHRRQGGYEEGEGSPAKDVRDRRPRPREVERERSRDADAEDRRRRRRERERDRERSIEAAAAADVARRQKHQSSESTNSASHLLSADALARLTSEHDKVDRRERSRPPDDTRRERRQRKRAVLEDAAGAALGAELAEGRSRHKSGARVVSGAYLEEGRSPEMKVRRRGATPVMDSRWNKEGPWETGSDSGDGGSPAWRFWADWSRKKRLWMGGIAAVVLLLVIIIPTAVAASKKHSSKSGSSSPSDSSPSDPSSSNLDGISEESIPSYAQGTYLDPFTWYDTDGFNVTFTNETVGGLSTMGINSTWDDSAQPNDQVPPLNEMFPYGSRPIRGVNLGGWLSIEPFIAPSLFESYSDLDAVVDEWTLSQALGGAASTTIEKHYATFITEQDFAEIAEAGLDHVRIQYSYWAVKIYDGDPYVPKIAWRYLLRAIEYARKYGLRVKLDIHGIPGSQNGWNHSGHQGSIGWVNGTDGELNVQRSLEIHDQLSQFFAQDRYKNVVTIYGLVNEPLMLDLSVEEVLDWNEQVSQLIRKNGVTATLVFSDGFLNLAKWKAMFKTHPDNMYLDTHQYTIFNTGEIVLNHTAKVELICNSWLPMIQQVNSTTEGWGPTMCGEWSQADTDCAKYLNNVGRGTRWEGTMSTTSSTAYCPTADTGPGCSCTDANADPSQYSAVYKSWLQTYAEAQMSAFETAMGWFYWTWHTETAAQWSYRTAWKNGFMPKLAYQPSFKCGDTVPDFEGEGLPEYY